MEILEYIFKYILNIFDFMKNINIFGMNMFTLYLSYGIVSLILIWFFVINDDDD